MKIRNGFVSNSSSSSFLISFDKDPKSINDVAKYLTEKKYSLEFFGRGYVTISQEVAAGLILEQLTDENKRYTFEQILEDVNSGSLEDVDWKNEALREYIARGWFSDNKNRHIYCVEFGNQFGDDSNIMEQEVSYRLMNGLRISKH